MPLHSHCQQPGSFKSGALTCRQAAIAKRPCLISISCHLTKHSSGSTCSCSCSSSVVQASVHATLTLHGDTQIAHRRYLSGILVISPSGSYTPSGFVVPMSPGVIADMTTDGATRLADRTGALNAEGAIATIEVAMLTADGNSNGNGSDREKQANTNLQPNAQARAEDERGSSRPCEHTSRAGDPRGLRELKRVDFVSIFNSLAAPFRHNAIDRAPLQS